MAFDIYLSAPDVGPEEERAILDAVVDRPQPAQHTWFDQARAVAVTEGVFAAGEFDELRDREPARAASFSS